MRLLLLLLGTLLLCTQCHESDSARTLGHMEAMAEMVQAGVKPLALSQPLGAAQAAELWPEAEALAKRYGIQVYREPELLATELFADSLTAGQEVFIFYTGLHLAAYQTLKEEGAAQAAPGSVAAREEVARRFGRLLGYPARQINALLAVNSTFRTAQDFGLEGQQVVFYYEDLERATAFYEGTLGLRRVATYPQARLFQLAEQSYLLLVADGAGLHRASEPKSVALALLTEQLPGWWAHLQAEGVPIRYGYTPREGGPHDGFVAIDPEGYLLEFETFKQHPENEGFVPQLRKNQPLYAQAGSTVPEGLGFHSTITWLYYRDVLGMQRFYEETMGLRLVADQGWTKVYQACATGFIGLVDERRGMHDYADEKAVSVTFLLADLDGWMAYAEAHAPLAAPQQDTLPAPAASYRRWVGYDPEKYTYGFGQYEAGQL